MLVIFRGIHKSCFNAQLRQPLTEEFRNAAIYVPLRDDVISTLQQGQNRSRNRRHPRRKQQCAIGALQFGNGRLRHGMSRVSIPGVKPVGGRGAHLLVAIGDFERRCLINRGRQRTILLAQIRAPADGFGFLAAFVRFHSIAPVRKADKSTKSNVLTRTRQEGTAHYWTLPAFIIPTSWI